MVNQAPPDEEDRRHDYAKAFKGFSCGLTSTQRAAANGAASPDWQGSKTFALPVNADNPAYSSEDEDEVIKTLDELAQMRGALPKIALWLNDKIGTLDMVLVQQQFRMAVARICDSKNSRCEAHLVSLAIGLNLSDNANGFAIAQHFGLTPQTFHDLLSKTCLALGVAKPLSKIKKDRYLKTQYKHSASKK